MEKLQERGLRFVTDDYSSPIQVILEQTKSKLLHVSRIKTIAKETYKILNKDALLLTWPPILNSIKIQFI